MLLLKGAPNKKLWPGKYNGLGGHIERGESVPAAARREIHEEAGLAVTNLRLRGVVTIDLENEPGIGMFVFTAQAVGRAVTASTEGSLDWVPLSQVPALDTVEDLPTLVPYVFNLPLDAPPFGARYYYDSGGQLKIEMFSEETGMDLPV